MRHGILFGQRNKTTKPHTGKINDIAISKNSVFTAGQDGFVIKWNEDGIGEHYQISDLEVKLIAVSPNGNDIVIYETDGYSVNRISVWDWNKQTRKFARRITDSVASLAYSEKGSWILVGTTSMDGVIFLDSTRGTVLKKVNDSLFFLTFSFSCVTLYISFFSSHFFYFFYTNLISLSRFS